MAKSILRGDIEYIIHCDKNGKIIGPISKLQAHLPGPRQALTHYSTWSMVFHPPSGTYGIQLKNPRKHDKFGAGKWDMGIAGHNCYVQERGSYRPMGFQETLVKEADEEIGLSVKIIDSLRKFVKLSQQPLPSPTAFFFEKFHYKTSRNNEFVGLALVLTPTTKLTFKDKEVVGFKWVSPLELGRFLKEERNYCDPLPLVYTKAEKFRKKYLPHLKVNA